MIQAPADPALDAALAAIEQPVLVIGGSGMLGRAFQELLTDRVKFSAPNRNRVDITDLTSVRRNALGPWRTYINCSAYTDVDGAESKEPDAMAANATGVSLLAQTCREVG